MNCEIDVDEDPLVTSIRDRVQLSLEAVQRLASEAGVGEHAETFHSALSNFDFVYGRVYEIIRRQRAEYEGRPCAPEWAEFYADGDNGGWDWKRDFPPQRGRPSHDTLLELFDLLRIEWNPLPLDQKKKRPKWTPAFERQNGEAVPINATGAFFWGIARLFASYSAANCASVADRARRRTWRPESSAKRATRRHAYAAEYLRCKRTGAK
jgi:hypothetical protein